MRPTVNCFRYYNQCIKRNCANRGSTIFTAKISPKNPEFELENYLIQGRGTIYYDVFLETAWFQQYLIRSSSFSHYAHRDQPEFSQAKSTVKCIFDS